MNTTTGWYRINPDGSIKVTIRGKPGWANLQAVVRKGSPDPDKAARECGESMARDDGQTLGDFVRL